MVPPHTFPFEPPYTLKIVSDDAPSPIPRTRVLVWLTLALVPAFVITGTITGAYHRHERTLAAEWFARADAERRAHRADAAVAALQNALRFSPERPDYRFALGRALVEARRPAEARAHLLSLWETEPGSGRVNLELGRLAVAARDTRAAVRYYHNAIEGSWHETPDEHRREARIELASYLIDRGERGQAHAELIPLVDDLPETPSQIAVIGRLLLAAGSASRARQAFEAGLKRAPRNVALLEGAGRAALEADDYAGARASLARAVRAGSTDPAIERDLAIATEVLAMNPFQRRLSRAQRAQRAREAFETAGRRLTACSAASMPAQGSISLLAAEQGQLAPRLSVRALRADPDLVETVMDLAFRVEEAAHGVCPDPTPRDEALRLLGRQHTQP